MGSSKTGKAVPTIRALALTPLVRLVDESGGGADGLLAAHGLTRAHLADPYSLIPLARYVAFFEAAAGALSDTLGLRVGSLMAPADLGPLGLLFSAAPTLSSGFARLTQYLQALQSATQAGLQHQGQVAAWSYRIEDPAIWPRAQDAEYTMATICQMIRSVLGRFWCPLEVQFEHAPSRASALERYFRAPVRFSQPANRLVMDSADLDRPIQKENCDLTRVLERHVGDLLIEPPEQANLHDRVRRLIGLYLGRERITVPRLAKDLGLSPRTLQRWLAEEGTSLRALLREHRQAMAEQRIGARHISNADIADLLGYADGTVFWRAFKGWTGRSPRSFRNEREA